MMLELCVSFALAASTPTAGVKHVDKKQQKIVRALAVSPPVAQGKPGRCPKCGYLCDKREYHGSECEGGLIINEGGYCRKMGGYWTPTNGEHIHWFCKCGWDWSSPVLEPRSIKNTAGGANTGITFQ